jgi:hypothetical protein
VIVRNLSDAVHVFHYYCAESDQYNFCNGVRVRRSPVCLTRKPTVAAELSTGLTLVLDDASRTGLAGVVTESEHAELQALSGGATKNTIGWDNPMPGELKNKWLE